MQLVTCNLLHATELHRVYWKSCVVACIVKLLQANRIVVYSLQHVAQSFKGFTGSTSTERLSRRGDLHTAKCGDFVTVYMAA